ncbi:MAG TPA: beta-galactosidase [Fimbriimonadaceae bacterium]|jgi:beta-galactosidase
MRKSYINPKFPSLWHGGDYCPEQWTPEIWDEDVRLMQKSRFTVATMGMFAWAKLEPSEGVYDFGWFDEVVDKLTKGERWFILGTPSAAPPAWFSNKYPETLRTRPNGVRQRHGNRVNFNIGSALYREKTREINRKLAERYGNHPRLLAWHLSNEYNGEDYSQDSIEQFREWLRSKFNNDLGALNHAYWTAFWGHTYGSWDEIDPPGTPYGETAVQGLTVDWKRFVTDQTIDFMLSEAEPLRELTPDVPITTNMMGTYPGLDYRKMAKHLDFISWDSYPAPKKPLTDPQTWITVGFRHDLMRSLKPDKPWLLMEYTPSSANWYDVMALKRPGMHRFESLHALAHGADGLQYFQWRQSRGGQEQFHGAVVSHSGSNTRIFDEVCEVGIELDTFNNLAGSTVKSEVALLFDWENRWALEAACGPIQGDKKYEETVPDFYRALIKAGVSVDIVGQDDSLDRYKLVVAPMAYSLRPTFIEEVKRFVKNGGHFLTTYLSGWVDENSLVFEGGFLAPWSELLGLTSEELDALYKDQTNSVDFLGENSLGVAGQFQATEFCEIVHPTTAEPLAVFRGEFYAGSPAVTGNKFGAGVAYYLAARTETALLDVLLSKLARAAGVSSVVDFELPMGVMAKKREAEDSETLFLLNTLSEPTVITSEKWGSISIAPYNAAVLTKSRELIA